MKETRTFRGLTLPLILCCALIVATASAVATLPGHAQVPPGEVPQVVRDSLARNGLAEPTNVRQRGPNYTANAITRTGAPVKVVIQGSTGAIIGFRIIAPTGPGVFQPR